MKRISLLVLAGALLLAMSAATATAKKPGGVNGPDKKAKLTTYVFKGELVSSGEDGGSLTVAVSGGNKAGRTAAAGGEPLSLAVTPETKVELDGQEATFADLRAGDDVVVQSKAPKGATSFTARVISAEREVVEPAPTEPAPTEPAPTEPEATEPAA